MLDSLRTNRLLEAIRLAQNEFILSSTSHTAFRVLLDELLALTESGYGFIGVVEHVADVFVDNEEDDTQQPTQPQLRVLAYTDISWNEETRQLLRDNATTGLLFENMDTLFGYAILNNQVVVANDAENDPRAGGIPDGHPPLRAFMGIPFYHGEELIGLIGLANREQGYSEDVADFLEPLITTCGIMAHSRRISLDRRRRDDLEEGAERTQRLVQFSQRLAHDLNNLLTVTMTTMEAILLSESPPERNDLSKVHATTKQAAQLTKKIMSFAGSTGINRSTVSVDAVIGDAISICESIFPSHIQLMTETVDDIPDVLADPPALKQAIINMVLNSIEAIGTESGVVWIRGDKTEEGNVVIEVSDDGHGMDDATKESAFDPYFSTRSEDRGFGLTSVHGFAKSHNATLEMSSKENVGTSIRITLPSTSPVQPAQVAVEFEFADKRILIVDDDTVILSAVSKLLKRVGVDVLTAESGEAALAVLGRVSDIDLVLLDVSMPAVDGVETSRRIRAKAGGLPIVFMSGQTKMAVPPDLSFDENSTFLSKPFTMATLREAFENVFNGTN